METYMTTKKNLLAIASVAVSMAALISCSSGGANIEGEWIQPVPGMGHMTQGFSLQEGGKASSINMATLQYKTWKQEGQSLLLSGESIGNAQTIAFTDTLVIERLTQDSLILKKGSLSLKYSRQAK